MKGSRGRPVATPPEQEEERDNEHAGSQEEHSPSAYKS
jgi:hypothetical protein